MPVRCNRRKKKVIKHLGHVHSAYNPSFSACFFSRNRIFLSQQISQQYFSAGLSAQPNDSLFALACYIVLAGCSPILFRFEFLLHILLDVSYSNLYVNKENSAK
jgi:hypothetical protein